MSASWFYHDGKKLTGPISGAELRQAALLGKIGPKTRVRKGEEGAWHIALKVKGLTFPSEASSEELQNLSAQKKPVASPPQAPPIPAETTPEPEDNFDVLLESFTDWEIEEEPFPPLPPLRSKSEKSTKKKKKSESRGVHPLVWIMLSIFCTLAVAVPLTLVAMGYIENPIGSGSEQAEVIPIAQAEPPQKEELAQKPVEEIKKSLVSGELFVTTQSGDVKRAAGLNLKFIRVTEEFNTNILSLKQRREKLISEQKVAIDEWEKRNPRQGRSGIEYTQWDSLMSREVYSRFSSRFSMLHNEVKQIIESQKYKPVVTNSDGKFQVNLENGTYLLMSDIFSVGNNIMVWCKVIHVEDELFLILNQESVVSRDTSIVSANEPWPPEISLTSIIHTILSQFETKN